MIKFETKIVFEGLAQTSLSSLKIRLRRCNVPFADMSSYYNENVNRRYLVLWFNERFEEEVFAHTLNGKLEKVVHECARDAGMQYGPDAIKGKYH